VELAAGTDHFSKSCSVYIIGKIRTFAIVVIKITLPLRSMLKKGAPECRG